MTASPLLSNVRHRAMITSVSALLTRLVVIPSYWKIYHSFEIVLEMRTVHRLDFKSKVLCKSISSKTL